MASFNPQLPNERPQEYLNQSKSISTVPVDRSTGLALSTAGNAIEGITEVTDRAIKDDINKQVYTQADAIRDSFTSDLEAIKGGQQSLIPGGAVSPGTDAAGNSLIPTDITPKVPTALQNVGARVEALQAARDGGKINDTYYTQQLNSMTKNLRSQYPGYRDYIDAEVSKVTGINPANAYMTNLMQDINRGLAARSQMDKDALHMITSNAELPNSDIMYANHLAARAQGYDDTPKIMQWLQQNLGWKNLVGQVKAQHEMATFNKGDANDAFTKDFNNIADSAVVNALNTMTHTTYGDLTAQELLGKIQDLTTQGKAVDPIAEEQLATILGTVSSRMFGQLQGVAREIDKNGNSYNNVMGGDKVNDAIKQRQQVLQSYIDAIRNKDYGTAFNITRQIQGIKDFDDKNVLTNSSISGPIRQLGAVQRLGGDQLVKALSEQFLRDPNSHFVGDIRTFVQDKTYSALTTPGSSLVDDLDKAKKLVAQKKERGETVAQAAQLYDKVLSIPTVIGSSDPRINDAAKLTMAEHAFNPTNWRLLDGINMDYTDPTTGKFVPGKYAAFTRLTSPDITNNMWKMRNNSQAGEKTWSDYKNWTDVSFLKLFREDVSNLDKYVNNQNMHVAWDSDNNRFTLLDRSGRPVSQTAVRPVAGVLSDTSIGSNTTNNAQVYEANKVINRLNSGLSSLTNVHSKEGGDTSTFLINFLVQQGFKPNANVQGMPQKILDAIAASKTNQAKSIEDTFFKPETP